MRTNSSSESEAQIWCNSEALDLISTPIARKPRKFLVFVVPRPDMASPFLSMSEDRNFDLAVRFYSAPGDNVGLLQSAEFVMTGGLSKFHAAALFIEACQLSKAYEGYLFLDGDLEFEVEKLSSFLSIAHAAQLDLAQPAVTRDSYCYWKMAYHQPKYVLRSTSFVEVMAPYHSQKALSRILETFTRSISTYGLDLVWPAIVGSSAIGVVDAFQIRHRERVDHKAGGFYNYLRSIGVDLDEEERLILSEYGVEPKCAHSLRGYFWKKSHLQFGGQPRLVSVPLDGPERRTEKQILIDIAMRVARLGTARIEDRLEAEIGPYLAGSQVR